MPGAMCGLWGVCGVVSSIGAALSIIDPTGKSDDEFKKVIMEIESKLKALVNELS